MTYKNLNSRCKGRTKAGKPCLAAATEGGLCFFHANPDKASELGRIGGRGNRHASPGRADPPPNSDTARAVQDMVTQLIGDLYSGKINPRMAAGMTPPAPRHRNNGSGAQGRRASEDCGETARCFRWTERTRRGRRIGMTLRNPSRRHAC